MDIFGGQYSAYHTVVISGPLNATFLRDGTLMCGGGVYTSQPGPDLSRKSPELSLTLSETQKTISEIV